MLGFSSGMLASMGEGSPSTLEGEAEDTRERPTAELALGLGDALRSRADLLLTNQVIEKRHLLSSSAIS